MMIVVLGDEVGEVYDAHRQLQARVEGDARDEFSIKRIQTAHELATLVAKFGEDVFD